MSFRDQVTVLGELLRRPVELRELTRERAAERLARHMPTPFVSALLDYWAYTLEHPTSAENHAGRIAGRPPRTFGQRVSENLAAFR